MGVDPNGAFRPHFQRQLNHSVADVWKAITNPVALETWMPGCTLETKTGGNFRFDFGEEGVATGEVIEATAPGDSGTIVHSWNWEGTATSHVTWHLVASDTGSTLTVEHLELPREPRLTSPPAGTPSSTRLSSASRASHSMRPGHPSTLTSRRIRPKRTNTKPPATVPRGDSL
ncbi:SRPBCC domain-containing protein [Natronoglycomyces albus]|uniref:SRPBCC domain-containing protein n=1 Tax=Natronoglycomyces albus TaxID=2811108 RepID=A0A895XPI2_9ACTN|nr:SRPBCC domain-containing protein [Natronoglycomyces albus]